MSDWRERMTRGEDLLYQKAIRLPLQDSEAERTCHENMMRIAAAGKRKSRLLDDPDVPVTEVYEDELAEMQQSFIHRLQRVAGENYHDVATAYLDGERDDWIGALAAYYLECYYRLQERYTVDEQFFFLLILRYPDCFTINLSFLTGDLTADAVRYESATHGDEALAAAAREQYYDDCQYSQHEAADYLRQQIGCIRDAFPDPETTAFEERQYGGFVHITGRQGSEFAEILDSIDPDLGRFSDQPTVPVLVPEGPEAKRAKRELFIDADVVV